MVHMSITASRAIIHFPCVKHNTTSGSNWSSKESNPLWCYIQHLLSTHQVEHVNKIGANRSNTQKRQVSVLLVHPLHDIMQTVQYSSLHRQIDHYHLHQMGKNKGIFIILITNAVACDRWVNLTLPSQLQNIRFWTISTWLSVWPKACETIAHATTCGPRNPFPIDSQHQSSR